MIVPNRIAVITGDIVGSSAMRNSRYKDKLLNLMKETLKEIKLSEKRGTIQPSFEIFRGDSFQGVVSDIKRSLVIAVKIKAGLQMRSAEIKKLKLDARISIGIGKAGTITKKIRESDGEAFQLSGRHLDKMKMQGQGIYITAANEKMNKHFESVCTLLDLIASKWTMQQAEVIYFSLNDNTQSEIAEKLNLAQPSVNQRLQLGNKKEVEKALAYFEWLSDSI